MKNISFFLSNHVKPSWNRLHWKSAQKSPHRLRELIYVVFLLVYAQSANAAFASGQDLLDGFAAFARIGTTNAKPTDPQQAARISGYVQGTIDSAVSAGIFCVTGKKLTLRNVEPAISQYLRSNPIMLKKAAVESVILSLHPAYKCD